MNTSTRFFSSKSSLIFGLFTLLAPSLCFAVGDAGCGLGHLAWQGRNGKLAQILAVTTNSTFGSQTFGITTGTSGCTASGLVQRDRELENFAQDNRDNLAIEIAQGQGEALGAFARMLQCNAEGQPALGSFAQHNMKQILPSSEVSGREILKNLRAVAEQDQAITTLCPGLVQI